MCNVLLDLQDSKFILFLKLPKPLHFKMPCDRQILFLQALPLGNSFIII